MFGTFKRLRSGSRVARPLREGKRFLLRVEELERRTLLATGVLGSVPALPVLATVPATQALNAAPVLSALNLTPANQVTNAATTTPTGNTLTPANQANTTPAQQTTGTTTAPVSSPATTLATSNATSPASQTGPNGQPNTTATQTQPFGAGEPLFLSPGTGPTGSPTSTSPAASSPVIFTGALFVSGLLVINYPAAYPQVVGITPLTTGAQPTPLIAPSADLQGSPYRFYDGHTGDSDANNNIGFGARDEGALNPDEVPPDNNQFPPLNPFTPGPATAPAGPAAEPAAPANVPLFDLSFADKARPRVAADQDPWAEPAAVERYRLASVAEQEAVASLAAVEQRGLDVQSAVLVAGLAAFLETGLMGEGTRDERDDRKRRRVPRHVPA